MQRRVVGVAAAAVVVLAAVLVLRWQVRGPARSVAVAPEKTIPAAGPEPAPAMDDHLAGRPPVAAPRSPRNLRAAAAKPPDGEGGGRAGTGKREPAGSALPPDAPQEVVILHNSILDAYERADFEASFEGAQDFLRRIQPDNAYLKRVAAVSACGIGDASSARYYYDQLDAAEQRVVAGRCGRYGITF
jgi:hypothetical protein